MALTNDEITEILELYGRGYSGRKIANKTLHSEVTVFKVIRIASEAVVQLLEKRKDVDEIASQLGYPLAFVNLEFKKHEEKQREVSEYLVEKKAKVEENEAQQKLVFREDWNSFQKKLEIEQWECTIKKKMRS